MMNEYFDRQRNLQHKMHSLGIDAFIVTHNVDIYYFTGSMQLGYLFVPAQGESFFFVRKSVSRARTEYGGNVEPFTSMRDLREQITTICPELFRSAMPVFATEFDVLPLAMFQRIELAFQGVKWMDGSIPVREIRMVKTPLEIAKIKASAQALDTAFEKALTLIRPGMTELELIARMELELRQMGHIGIMRMRAYNSELSAGIIVSGASAAYASYFDGPAGGEGLSSAYPLGASRRSFEPGVPILVDVGCCIDGYLIDQSRTVVIGELNEELKRVFEVAEAVAKHTESKLRPGTVCEQLYIDALKMVEVAGLSDHFMGYKEDRARFLGHGIGLEIDELPVLAEKSTYELQPGMVIAIEPKFTFPGRGVVGTEDTYVITETGFEKLSLSRSGLIKIMSSKGCKM